MYKTVRTAIIKILMEYQKRHDKKFTGCRYNILILEDNVDETVAALVETYRDKDCKLCRKTVTITIQEDVECLEYNKEENEKFKHTHKKMLEYIDSKRRERDAKQEKSH